MIARQPANNEDPNDPIGSWVLTDGLSIYTISRTFEAGKFSFEQAMAGGKVLSGDLVALPAGEDWTWLVDLQERGTVRLRRKERYMQTSFQKRGATTWAKPRCAERMTAQ